MLLSSLLQHTEGTSFHAEVKRLFFGSLSTYMRCHGCGASSARAEAFSSLFVAVSGVSDLECGLDALLAPELLSGANQWRCSACGRKSDATRGGRLQQLPPLLALQLGRFGMEYSKAAGGFVRAKLHACLDFPPELFFCLDEGSFRLAPGPAADREAGDAKGGNAQPATRARHAAHRALCLEALERQCGLPRQARIHSSSVTFAGWAGRLRRSCWALRRCDKHDATPLRMSFDDAMGKGSDVV